MNCREGGTIQKQWGRAILTIAFLIDRGLLTDYLGKQWTLNRFSKASTRRATVSGIAGGRMRVLVISNAFKAFASSRKVGEMIRVGIHAVRPQWIVDVIPIADGGEGTVQTLIEAWNGIHHSVRSVNAVGLPISTSLGIHPNGTMGVIEVSGLLSSGKISGGTVCARDLSSFGVGLAILEAHRQFNISHLLIGLGGSVACDGGLGMAQALGATFVDAHGEPLYVGASHLTSRDIERIHRIEISSSSLRQRLPLRLSVLADVSAPLLGDNGQARAFGPNKGLADDDVDQLEDSLHHWSGLLRAATGRFADVPMAGAGGGIASFLYAALHADLISGTAFVLDAIHFDDLCRRYDIVITGEGCLDETTLFNKAPLGIAPRCAQY